jgi:hypothetical protein
MLLLVQKVLEQKQKVLKQQPLMISFVILLVVISLLQGNVFSILCVVN